jgi:RimJ/RimL family protein N-acetyltransferase
VARFISEAPVTVPTNQPILRTERLQLTVPQQRHFDAFADLHSDPDTMAHIGDGAALDRVSAWLQLAMLRGHWDLRGYGVWMIEDAGNGDFVGRAGLLHPPGWDEPELNWMVVPAKRGYGLAAEAANAALDHALDVLGFVQVMSLIRPENMASSRLAVRLGGYHADTIDFLGAPMHVYRYRRDH